jgi:hypothetical protein
MFTGIKTGPAGVFDTKTVQANILSQIGDGDEGHDLHWMTENFTVIDPGKDIDILVLVPDHLLLGFQRDFTLKAGDNDVGLGGDCEFLGFPYGGGWKTKFQDAKDPSKENWVWLPYIKHCTPSARLQQNGLAVWVLDGLNNEGFSGGPVLYATGPKQEVFAVISGFHQEPLEVLPAPNPGEAQTSSVPPAPKLPGKKSKEPEKLHHRLRHRTSDKGHPKRSDRTFAPGCEHEIARVPPPFASYANGVSEKFVVDGPSRKYGTFML